MFSIIKALVRIAKNLKEIRDILSIAHHDAIERYKLEQLYIQQEKRSKKDDEIEYKEIEDEYDLIEEEISKHKEEEFRW